MGVTQLVKLSGRDSMGVTHWSRLNGRDSVVDLNGHDSVGETQCAHTTQSPTQSGKFPRAELSVGRSCSPGRIQLGRVIKVDPENGDPAFFALEFTPVRDTIRLEPFLRSVFFPVRSLFRIRFLCGFGDSKESKIASWVVRFVPDEDSHLVGRYSIIA